MQLFFPGLLLPGQAINLALLSVVSMCIGAGEFKQARYYTRKLMMISTGCTVFISSVLVLFGPWIMKIYQLTPETESLTVSVIRYYAVLAVFSGCRLLLCPIPFALPEMCSGLRYHSHKWGRAMQECFDR